MKVIWDPRAKEGERQVVLYIRHKFGSQHARKFIDEVNHIVGILKENPQYGSIDTLFEERAISYRSIIIRGLSKLVYYIKDDTICIAAFWDTRREPVAQAQRIK
jgi:plasmid stabilization system protein ParE